VGLRRLAKYFPRATYNAEVRANVFVETGVELMEESMDLEIA
jgi:hypothetical protein